MSYDDIRLEDGSGTVVAYLAPTFEITPTDQNDVLQSPRGRERQSIVRNNGLWVSELVAQGNFQHSDNLRPDHRQALQTLFGRSTITPSDQINRLRAFTVYADTQGILELYHNDNQYTATLDSDVNVTGEYDEQTGEQIEPPIYPVVAVTELRHPEDGAVNNNRIDFLIRMAIGTPRGDQEPSAPQT